MKLSEAEYQELEARVARNRAKKTSSAQPTVGTPACQRVFVIHWKPVGKPRMTQRDKWAKRPAVLRYREFCDRARSAAGEVPVRPLGIHVTAYLPMPSSWSNRKRLDMDGKPHRQKPDGDNILKSVADALLDDDSCLALMTVRKFWTSFGFERVRVEWVLENDEAADCQANLSDRRLADP